MEVLAEWEAEESEARSREGRLGGIDIREVNHKCLDEGGVAERVDSGGRRGSTGRGLGVFMLLNVYNYVSLFNVAAGEASPDEVDGRGSS